MKTSDNAKMIVDVSASTERMTTRERLVIYISDAMSLPVLHSGSSSIGATDGITRRPRASWTLSVTYPTKRDVTFRE